MSSLALWAVRKKNQSSLCLPVSSSQLHALCEGTFLANGGLDVGDLDEPIPFLRNAGSRAERFRFYDLSSPASLSSEEIQFMVPRALWRLYQFDVLAELTIHFICLHEISHWALGHLGLAAARTAKVGVASLSEVAQAFAFEGGSAVEAPFQSAEMRCLEMQADFLAIQLHYFYHRAHDTHKASILSAYSGIMTKLVHARGTVLGTLDEAQEHRLLSCAAGAMFTLIETWAEARDSAHSSNHPLPEARALQLLTVTIALANWKHRTERADGQSVLRTTDQKVIAEIEKTVRGQFQSLLIDMYGMSRVLGIPALFLRTDVPTTKSEDRDLSSQSATFQDLLHLLFEGAKSVDQLSTQGGRQFFELRALDAALRAEAEPYAVHRPTK